MSSYIHASPLIRTHTLFCLPASTPLWLPFPQSAVLFLESLLGQENVYTVAMVRNLPGASIQSVMTWSLKQSPLMWLCLAHVTP